MALRTARQRRDTENRRKARLRGSRFKGAADAVGRAASSTASGTANAARGAAGRIRNPRGGASGGASRFTGADTSARARADARASAQASRQQGRGGSGPRTGTGARGPAPDVTVDRSGGSGRFNRNPLTGSTTSRAAGAVGRGAMAGLRLGGKLFKLGPQAAIVPSALGADDTESGELFEGAAPISDARAAELEAAGGANPLDGVPTQEEVEAATTPGAEDPAREQEEDINWGPARTRGGRLRLDGNRPETVGRDGTVIESARGDEAEAARLQLGAPAPDLPGVPPGEQEIIRATDGQGGVGTLRAPAGVRRGGGTFSVMENAAAAAVPVDNEGVHQARLAAIERGERVSGVGDGETRRQRLRREINSSRGLNQSFGSMIQEGIRRRNAVAERDQLNAQALQAQSDQAAMLRKRLGRQPTALEVAEAQREANQATAEERRAQGEYDRKGIDRMFEENTEDGVRVNVGQRNRALGLLQNAGIPQNPSNAQTARNALEVTDRFNDLVEEENRLTFAGLFGGGPDNPFDVTIPGFNAISGALGLTGQRPPDPDTLDQALQQIADVAEVRVDEDLIFDDRVVDINGTEVELSQIPPGIRQMAELMRSRMREDGDGRLFREENARQTR